jgi:hypothetical protein
MYAEYSFVTFVIIKLISVINNENTFTILIAHCPVLLLGCVNWANMRRIRAILRRNNGSIYLRVCKYARARGTHNLFTQPTLTYSLIVLFINQYTSVCRRLLIYVSAVIWHCGGVNYKLLRHYAKTNIPICY